MRIQHNIMAMNAYRNYTANTSAVAKNLEKLSSGYRINRAGDDAAGLAISEKMRAQITGLSAAQKNVKDGISLVKTAEGATQEIHDMLNRMVYLAEQSSNGTYQDEVDREAITNEFSQLKEEINRITKASNFNGIKLLDGSLSGTNPNAKITIAGNVSSKNSEGAAGMYFTNAAIADGTGAVKGGTASYSVALSDGKSYTVDFTFDEDDAGNVTKMVAADGSSYTITQGAPKQDEIAKAIAAELEKTDFGKMYNISANMKSDATGATPSAAKGQFVFTAKEAGTKTPTIKTVDYHADYAKTGNAYTLSTAMNVEQAVKARDEGREIDADNLTLYDGTNYDDAVFTINGKKFVVMVGDNAFAGATPGTVDTMNATLGLGSDVTVLISDGTTKNGLKQADTNFQQNIDKISEVTGLNVTDALTEAVTDNQINAGSGIRLSGAVEGKGGLVLQIGDTSDDYNQMRVSIKAMDTKSLGIDNLDLGSQAGAQAAVGAIKDAINYVSDVRGTLGATQNRLEHTQNNLSVMKENIQDAESSIRDTDIAEEMMAYTKNNILVQSAQAMLAQANQVPQGVLQLLG